MPDTKKISMFKDGHYIPWDGSDVGHLVVEETITVAQLKKYYPKEYRKFKKNGAV